jgi:predicted O-methyltransferase YrrM
MPDLMSLLHEVSPYEDHDLAAHPGDLQGWGSTDQIFEAAIAALRPNVIVEVGTWKGASAIHMARIAHRLGLPTQIICVDTWLGSPEHFMGVDPAWRSSLRLRNGYPQLYFTFLSNVISQGWTHRIIPLPATSENAAEILAAKGIRPDLVYIDAAHSYEAVLRDLRLFWRLLSDNGILLGDDYILWPDVTRAANDFAAEIGCQLIGKRGKFTISKNPRLQPVATTPGTGGMASAAEPSC